ncbi:uncharacterized protein HMPREF1541_02903 [Cyphellophora europaea CBS 101466]|uniref:pH-response regulator protein palC n=1 Tax=Cyphellophora europaea (strain CBS 101466) TaxID=1220924 RepID=W2S730_CYPE1|nr:uncharacterized protein HMPREF1541_02903 [Cyphellophora europaea CBS 101466]ETN43744.1 hypothetical protein HMPREF1541_02903 [Cyphellophora europaea CBS 101466]
MPFPFAPSTTSQVAFQSHLTSSTHPSLPSATTSQRSVVRSALKSHKRLSASDQSNNLSALVTALSEYLKYLCSLDLGLSGKPVSNEDVDIALINEIEVEWRPTLGSSNIPGREAERVKGKGLDFELYFVHHTLAVVYNLLARHSLLGLYATTTPTADQRLSFIRNAIQSLTKAYSLHAYLSHRSSFSADGPPTFPAPAADISQPVQSALQHLTQAEINLLSVLKDDPYPAQVLQSRNKDDKEWMIKAPEKPKARVAMLQRLCIGAAEKAASASVALKTEGKRASKDLIEYCEDLRATARAKACRFAAVEADTSGETGKAIAWIRAGLNELGIEISSTGSKSTFSKLKNTYAERKEDKRIAKGDSTWGVDGGKAEEGRILAFLETKFTKANDTINIQLIPEWKPLLAQMPGAMVFPVNEKWKPVTLAEDELAAMRALPDGDNLEQGAESSDEDEVGKERRPAGAFPGTDEEYGRSNYY